MPPIRYAVWAAVSTDAQAANDKYSLPEQIERCQEHAASRNWQESMPAYVVPGESRTRYVNLSDAEQDIPQLKTLLDDAQSRKFDVLMVSDFDRFRDLLDPVSRTLAGYGVQIYSVSQPLEPQPPAEFDPYATDTSDMLIGLNQIVSRAAVANLRRKYRAQMPLRVMNKGLPTALIPYGYRKPAGRETDHNVVPEQNPALVPAILYMRDQLMTGRSLESIADDLNAQGVPSPGSLLAHGTTLWWNRTVAYILRNPFYAGYVRWGLTRVSMDPRTRKKTHISNPESRIAFARGKHVPLWDDDTYQAILAELARRSPKNYRGRITDRLSCLLYCSVCGAPLWRRKKKPLSWMCSVGHSSHVIVRDAAMLTLIGETLSQLVQDSQVPSVIIAADRTAELQRLVEQRTRVGDAYQRGLFDLDEFARRTSALDAEIASLERINHDAAKTAASSMARTQALEFLRAAGDDLSTAISTGERQLVNKTLKQIISKIVITPAGTIEKIELMVE